MVCLLFVIPRFLVMPLKNVTTVKCLVYFYAAPKLWAIAYD
jgi:hypothetical protein